MARLASPLRSRAILLGMILARAMATTSAVVRKFKRHPKPPPFIPLPPSDTYIALSQIPSTQLSVPQDAPRKLLVLDLNGTLLVRSQRAFGTARIATARPYAKTFREYVFHENSRLDVMVWSSAQPHSVSHMIDVFFGQDRSRLAGVWARDTLGLTADDYSRHVQTVKNLDIVWNAPAGLPPPIALEPPEPMEILTSNPSSIPGYDPSRPKHPKIGIRTSAQLTSTQAPPSHDGDRQAYWSTPSVHSDDPIPGLGSATDSTAPGPYSALNTLLLDDSPLKAHLQPFNNLTLPEYNLELRERDVRRRSALERVAHADPDASKEELSKILRAPPFDKTLIAVIGVLHAVRYESSIVGWMRAGGMRPGVEEMTRLSKEFEEEQHVQAEEAEEDGDEEDERTPLKRLPEEHELQSPKRRRTEEDLAGDGLQANDAPSSIVPATSGFLPADESDPPDPSTHISLTPPTQSPRSTKRRRRQRRRGFPVNHPLGAIDPAPFFIGADSDRLLWFQNREIYTYWVRRGVLALREYGIVPQPDVS